MGIALEERKVDSDKLNAVIGKVVNDFGATISTGLAVIGDKLGLYKAMADGEPITPAELAKRTGTDVRYITPWLVNQAAGGYVEYDPRSKNSLCRSKAHVALATEGGNPFFVVGGFELFLAPLRAESRIEEAFRSGAGMTWGEHTTACSRAQSASSSRATWATWWQTGCRLWTVWCPGYRRARK